MLDTLALGLLVVVLAIQCVAIVCLIRIGAFLEALIETLEITLENDDETPPANG